MNGQFRSCATALKQSFPELQIEGGPYTPPVGVQHAIKAVRFGQVATVALYFFGDAIFGSIGRLPPTMVQRMHDNPLLVIGGVYGLDVIAQTLKSINAFEVTYNGQVLHSKLSSGRFPQPNELVAKLGQIRMQESSQAQQQRAG